MNIFENFKSDNSLMIFSHKIMDLKIFNRIQNIKSKIMSYSPSICIERARLITKSYMETEGKPSIIRRALAIQKILEEMTIHIIDNELIVGNQSYRPRAAPIFPEFSINWLKEELNGKPFFFSERPGDKFSVRDEEVEELLNLLKYWNGKTHQDYVLEIIPKKVFTATNGIGAFDSLWNSREGCGHIVPDYEKIISRGFLFYKRKIENLLEGLNLELYEDIQKRIFYKSLLIIIEAVINFSYRFSKKLKLLSEIEENIIRKQELIKLSKICKRVPAKPSTSFWEAIQCYWLIYLINHIESNAYSLNIGRFDQILCPYYIKDINKGEITIENALELVENFFLKVNTLNKIKCWDDTETFTGYQMFTSLTVGGTDLKGNSAINDISFMCLKSFQDLRLPMPSLCVRYFNEMNEDFFIECIKTIKLGGGMPAIYNDNVAIPALLNRGVSVEDAYNWAIEGCVEMTVPGKWGGRYGASFFNLPKILEITLNGGKDPNSGITLFKMDKKLNDFNDFNDLFTSFKSQIKEYIKLVTIADNINDFSWENNVPVPYLSLLVNDCIDRGKQVHSGGAIYDYTGGQLVGIALVADSLAALKKVVFEEKIINGEIMLEILNSNFNYNKNGINGEEIRNILIKKCPKYGNDINYVDNIAKDIFIFYNSVVENQKNTRYKKGPIGGHFHPSTATVVANVPMGKIVGATPNGRKAFEPLSEGLSPFRGSDKFGPTSVLKTVSKMPNFLYSGGQLLNMKLNPIYLKGDEGTKKILDLLRGYFLLGGYHIQINFVDNKTLKNAKLKPENYKDLIVRVAGYSAQFISLDPKVQDDIIERTEHGI